MKYRFSDLAVRITLALLFLFCGSSFGQRIAILTPDGSAHSRSFAEQLSDALDGKLRIVDAGAAESAFRSIKVESPFNLTTEQSKSIGTVIGSDFFLIVRSATQRRTSSVRPNYYEAYAVLCLVNSRTGFLDHWHLETKNGDTAVEAEKLLNNSVSGIADAIAAKVKNAKAPAEPEPEFESFDPDSKVMRPPMPYKRIKPEYTSTAYLYGIAPTVDAEVSIDAAGGVKRIDITRWAGYGLDESVIAAIRQMNWRPGERGGKPLPMRVLLRYNFTKIEKD